MTTHPTPWDTNLILACRRCQKRLRKSEHPPAFAKLKKWLKARARKRPISGFSDKGGELRPNSSQKNRLHLIEIPCQKICPKHGLVVFSQPQLATQPAGFSVIRTEAQMESFYRHAK